MNKKKYRKLRIKIQIKRKLRKRNRRKKRKGNGTTIVRTQWKVEDILSLNTAEILQKRYKIETDTIWRRVRTLGMKNISKKFVVPQVFSLTKNPENSINFARNIFKNCIDHSVSEIELDFSKCKEIDLDASTLLDVYLLALDMMKQKYSHFELNLKGTYLGIDSDIRYFLKVAGLFKHFKISTPDWWEEDKQDELNEEPIFELVRGCSNSEKSGKIATDIINYFDHCLQLNGYCLTKKGKSNFGNMLGEVVDNCEIHSGKKAVWHVIGHYAKKGDNQEGELQLVIFDIGSTVYESFLSEDSSEEMQEKFRYLRDCHLVNFDKDWDEEALATVFVLQSKISRKRDSKEPNQQDRGTGTIRLIERLMDIGCTSDGKRPIMSIISGATQILFSEDYKLKEKTFEDDKIFGNDILKIIAFNKNNNLYERPDKSVVKKIKSFFPGTMITMHFYLDRKYIGEQIDSR